MDVDASSDKDISHAQAAAEQQAREAQAAAERAAAERAEAEARRVADLAAQAARDQQAAADEARLQAERAEADARRAAELAAQAARERQEAANRAREQAEQAEEEARRAAQLAAQVGNIGGEDDKIPLAMVYESKKIIGHITGPPSVVAARQYLVALFEREGLTLLQSIVVRPAPKQAGKPPGYDAELQNVTTPFTETEATRLVEAANLAVRRDREAGNALANFNMILKVDNLPGLQAARYGHPSARAAELGLVGLELGFTTKQPKEIITKLLESFAEQAGFVGEIQTADIRRTVLRRSDLDGLPETIYYVRTNKELAFHAALQPHITILDADDTYIYAQARLPTILEDWDHDRMLYASTPMGSLDRSSTGGLVFGQIQSRVFAKDPEAILTAYRPRAWGAENNPNVNLGHYCYVVLRDKEAATTLLTKVVPTNLKFKPIELKPRQKKNQKKGK
jgi:hypothetical protein